MNINDFNKFLASCKILATCVKNSREGFLEIYDLVLNPGGTVKQIIRKSDELSLFLRAKSKPEILTLLDEGIIRLRFQMELGSIKTWKELKKKHSIPNNLNIPCLLGEDLQNNPVWIDLATHPHTLIAGCSGSGKSVLLKNIINNLLTQSFIKIYLVDPKQVEFSKFQEYKDKVCCVVSENEEVIDLLDHLIKTMEQRYSLMASLGINSWKDKKTLFNKIIVVIDEIADLFLNSKNGKLIKELVLKLAQKARAAGIFLIAATQRPSADIVDGNIKANFPARLACKTASAIDSRIVLDKKGAELLLGKGDCLIQSSEHEMKRFQVAFVE